MGVSARKVFLMVLLASVATSTFCRARRGLNSLSIPLHVTEHGEGVFLLSLAEARNIPGALTGSWRRYHCAPPSQPGSTPACTCSWSLPPLRGAADSARCVRNIAFETLFWKKMWCTKTYRRQSPPLWTCQPSGYIAKPLPHPLTLELQPSQSFIWVKRMVSPLQPPCIFPRPTSMHCPFIKPHRPLNVKTHLKPHHLFQGASPPKHDWQTPNRWEHTHPKTNTETHKKRKLHILYFQIICV